MYIIYSEFQKVGQFLLLKMGKDRAAGNWSYFGGTDKYRK